MKGPLGTTPLLPVQPGKLAKASSTIFALNTFAISIISDAITDPLVGTLSDKINTLVGRRHPFMFLSALPLGIGLYFLYAPLNGLSEIGYFIWLVVFLIITKFGLTLYIVPHDGLGAELTDDYDERSSLFGYNEVGTMLYPSILALIVYVVIFPSGGEFENGMLNGARYIILAITASLVAASCALICSIGTFFCLSSYIIGCIFS